MGIFISTRLVLHTFNSSQDSRKISNFINFSINTFKIFLILGSFSLIRVLYSFAFTVKTHFYFQFLVDGISFKQFCFVWLFCSYNNHLFNKFNFMSFGSNTILPIILTYNRKFLIYF